MSERTDHARRLELSQVQDVGDFVSGRARGLEVSLEGAAPFTACVVELGAAIPIARMRMISGDLNHPDAVETGDVDFDERMQVTSLPTYAPTLQQLLAPEAVRGALLGFFTKYPDAQFAGTKLRVPAGAEGVTQKLIADALEVAELLVKRFSEIGFLSTEPRTTLPDSFRKPEIPWGQLAIGTVTGSVIWFGLTLAIGLDDPAIVGFGGVVSIGAALLSLMGRSEK